MDINRAAYLNMSAVYIAEPFLKTFLSWTAIAVMGVTFSILVFRYFSETAYPDLPLGKLLIRLRARHWDEPVQDISVANRKLRRTLDRNAQAMRHQLRVFGWVAAMTLISRAAVILSALFFSAVRGSLYATLNGFFDSWIRWDAQHYIGLAQNWYTGDVTADARFHLVFYPLYPLLTRGFNYIFIGLAHVQHAIFSSAGFGELFIPRDDYTVLAAIVLSNLCLLVSGYLLYQLVFEQQGERAARRAVRFFMFCPLTIFFSIPYTESLFIMLTLLSVLFARRRFFSAAVAVGALSSATRSLGLLVAVPIFLEMLKHVGSLKLWPPRRRDHYSVDELREALYIWPSRRNKHIALIAAYVLMVSLVGLGFLAYLALNTSISGDPLRFLTYQREHWGQTFGSISNTIRYTVGNAFFYPEVAWRLGTWVPQIIAIIATVSLLGAVSHRVHPGDGAYAWLYLICALSPTWLLSGPRYISAMYALYPMLTLVTRRKWQDIITMVIMVSLLAICSCMYAVLGNLL